MQSAAAVKVTPCNAILQALSTARSDLSLVELLKATEPQGIEDAAIKAAVWQLLGHGLIELTTERKVRLVASHQAAA